MKITRAFFAIFLLSGLTTGCGTLPNAEIDYFLPVTEKVAFTVVRTLSCSKANEIFTAVAVTPNVVHRANRTEVHPIYLNELSGILSDSEVKIALYPDGRLKSFGAKTTGHGQTILETALGVLLPTAGVLQDPDKVKACKQINTYGTGEPGKTKTLTITYKGGIDLSTEAIGKKQGLAPTEGDKTASDAIVNLVGGACAEITAKEDYQPVKDNIEPGDPSLTVRKTTFTDISVTIGGKSFCGGDEIIWNETLQIAEENKVYEISIPEPAVFGQRNLSVSFSEVGNITSIDFSANTGAGQFLGLTKTILDAGAGETEAEKLTRIKTRAEIIVQQQRLAKCLANPAECK